MRLHKQSVYSPLFNPKILQPLPSFGEHQAPGRVRIFRWSAERIAPITLCESRWIALSIGHPGKQARREDLVT